MPTRSQQTNNSKQMSLSKEIKTIDEALKTLNESASESSERIQALLESDYKKLKDILLDTKPKAEAGLGELKKASLESLVKAKDELTKVGKEATDSLDASVHKKPWAYIGGAAVVAGLIGFLAGRK